MIGRRLEQYLTIFGVWSRAQLDHTARQLREDGLLPLGGRGTNAPKLTPEAAANFLIALASSPSLGEAARYARLYGDLRPVRPTAKGLGSFSSFQAALTAVLSDPEGKLGLDHVDIYKSWPLVRLVSSAGGLETAYGYDTSEAAKAAGFFASPIAVITRINASILSQIALGLTRETTPGGWAAEST